jgi:hypothetical protein
MQVYKQAVLPADAALEQVGLMNGDQLVLLGHRNLQQPLPPQITPVSATACSLRKWSGAGECTLAMQQHEGLPLRLSADSGLQDAVLPLLLQYFCRCC